MLLLWPRMFSCHSPRAIIQLRQDWLKWIGVQIFQTVAFNLAKTDTD
ncbi:hypothetical protein AAZX31_13G068100 [Glycine max]